MCVMMSGVLAMSTRENKDLAAFFLSFEAAFHFVMFVFCVSFIIVTNDGLCDCSRMFLLVYTHANE